MNVFLSKSSRTHLPEETTSRTTSNRTKESAGSRTLKVRTLHKVFSSFSNIPDRQHRLTTQLLQQRNQSTKTWSSCSKHALTLQGDSQRDIELGQLKEERRAKRLKKASVTRDLLMCKSILKQNQLLPQVGLPAALPCQKQLSNC